MKSSFKYLNFQLKVSIITITFNSKLYFEKTIQSVLNQTYPNIEYIIIDGGSTDGTLDIIKKYRHQIAFWVSEKDDGISDAFNKGLNKATGDIVGIINSDDFYSKSAVEQVVKVFDENPEIGFLFGDQIFIDAQGNELFTQKGDPGYINKINYEMPSIPHPTVFVRNRIYQNYGGFDKTYKTAMDYEYLLRISSFGVKGLYLPSILSYMRLGGESDHNYIGAYREVRRISVKYGYSPFKAWLRYYYKFLKTYTRKNCQRFGLEFIVKWFRTYIGRRYKY